MIFEPGFKPDDEFYATLAGTLIDFMQFNGCENIKLVKVKPSKAKTKLNKTIKTLL
jgi:hypothetical protein